MGYLFCYDIENNALRTQLHNKLLEYGFVAIQRSVFITDLDKESLINEIFCWLEKKIARNAYTTTIKIVALRLHNKQVATCRSIGNINFDKGSFGQTINAKIIQLKDL